MSASRRFARDGTLVLAEALRSGNDAGTQRTGAANLATPRFSAGENGTPGNFLGSGSFLREDGGSLSDIARAVLTGVAVSEQFGESQRWRARRVVQLSVVMDATLEALAWHITQLLRIHGAQRILCAHQLSPASAVLPAAEHVQQRLTDAARTLERDLAALEPALQSVLACEPSAGALPHESDAETRIREVAGLLVRVARGESSTADTMQQLQQEYGLAAFGTCDVMGDSNGRRRASAGHDDVVGSSGFVLSASVDEEDLVPACPASVEDSDHSPLPSAL